MKFKNRIWKSFVCICLTVLSLVALVIPLNASGTPVREVYVGGTLFGATMLTDGVPIVSIDGVETDSGIKAPAYDAGLKVKDIIKEINGSAVTSTEDVTAKITESGGRSVTVTVLRGDKRKSLTLTPVRSKDGVYRAGFWIRDSAAGIGTVTYIIPETLEFGGLGHGICDGGNGSLMPLLRGSVSEVTLLSVVKGQSGAPGEIKGSFKGGKIGALTKNRTTGVYGIFASLPENTGERIKVARRDEVSEGEALVRSSVSGKPEYYRVKLTKLNMDADNGKNFSVEVIDEGLLKISGGIVQGMSGSPIIQNGKLVGAVTHVLINEPTRGYGIFIENMLSAAQMPMQKAA